MAQPGSSGGVHWHGADRFRRRDRKRHRATRVAQTRQNGATTQLPTPMASRLTPSPP